jgi:hypothetical protein
MKKGIVQVRGQEIEQFVLQNENDVEIFFNKKKVMQKTSLREAFFRYVSCGVTIILDTKVNAAGFYSWRATGEEQFILLRLV